MFALDDARFQRTAAELNLPAYRLAQIRQWIYGRFTGDFYEMSNLSLALRETLAGKYRVTNSQVVAVRTGTGSVKLLVQYPDGAKIETVIMLYRDWSSACLSTQVGCAMGCTFCATGPMGLERNLTAEEMAEQLWHCCHYAKVNSLQPVRNIVLMGIGEPLANYRNVVEFIYRANDPQLFDIGQRRITLSTAGLISQIQELAGLKLAITLAVSLHAPNDKLRNQLMPISRKYPLQDIIAACRKYTEVTGRRVTYEYLLLAGINDQDSHGAELARLLKGENCLINLIPFNQVSGVSFRPSSRAAVFQKQLEQAGLNATIRRSLGQEIDAACGQLRKGLPEQ
ncbi:MAG: 23S rRNA (adenine(2503)-C(2))-methyltransferase RlmN [Eubacteriales bacterium]|nr:23S rRNA (adenine(2503)-C(2))-methyltransferase RlmN [Eubacteriales bacterium]